MKRTLLVALLFTTPVEASVTAVKNVRLFDGTKMIPSATVVFTGGVITSAGPFEKVPDGATVIDGSGKTLLPGLIAAHTHVFPGSLERALRFGVTTELDMFTSSELAQKLKAEQKNGEVTSRADLRSANILVTVAGGHGSEYFPIPVYVPGSDPQAFVDARIAEGSDYIKLIYDNGSEYGLSFNTLTKSDLAALIAAAHKRGKMAVVHISTLQFARDAIESGADGLAHIFNDVGPDAGFGKFVHTHRAFVVPTLSVNESASGVASAFHLTDRGRIAPKLRADLVLVNGDPTTDILATRDIVTVWKGGVPLERKQETKEAQAAVETIPADKLAAGVVSTFESGTPDAQIGSMWVISTDSFVGGNSTATMDVVDGGANGTAKSLHIHTDTKPGTAFPWAGAMIFLASTPMRPVDVSSKSGFSFFAKGNVDIRLMVFSLGAGRIPHMTTVHAGPERTEITARWSDFGFGGKDIQAIHFAGPGSGTADFQIDELRLK